MVRRAGRGRLVSEQVPVIENLITAEALREEIEQLFAEKRDRFEEEHFELFGRFKRALNLGTARAAEPDPASSSGWRVNPWVKQGILLGFRMGALVDMSVGAGDHSLPFFDKATYPLRGLSAESGVRMVPGGSSIRDGVYLGRGVTCMPPMFVNAGAWVDDGTLIDSHALVGSCAQVGKRVHLSAAAQLGGVLEPIGALPVIVEDDVLVGGNCGVYEGTIIKRRAVLAAGTIITGTTPLYDTTTGEIISAAPGEPLVVPEGAVVVPGTRPLESAHGRQWGLSVATPIIVKYRDERTSARTALEQWIR